MRELLEATLEWGGAPAAIQWLDAASGRYRISRLTSGRDATSLLCEAAPGGPLPGYRHRRLLRRALDRAPHPNLIIFTDAAHTALVWTWITRGALGHRVYKEISIRPGEPWGPLRPLLESISGTGDAPGPREPWPDEPVPSSITIRRMLESLAAGMDAGPDAPASSRAQWAQAVQDAIDLADGEASIRSCWKALLASRVIDLHCGSGEWLACALEYLLTAYEACLQRMRSAVDDLSRIRPPGRADRLHDFKRLVARAGDLRRPEEREAFLTELALLHNLRGADRSTTAVRACRRRLIARVPAQDIGDGLLALTIVNADGSDGFSAGPDDSEARPDFDLIDRAVATILRMHIAGDVDPRELTRAMAAAGARMPAQHSPIFLGCEGVGCRGSRPYTWTSGLRIVRSNSATV